MAITTSAITSSFKNQLLSGTHNFDASGGNKFKLALYTDSAVIGPGLASLLLQDKLLTQLVIIHQVVKY